MIRERKLDYCPRTKHCVGRFRLKKANPRCAYQKDGLCHHAPSLLRYLKANKIKVKLTDNWLCVATIRPSIYRCKKCGRTEHDYFMAHATSKDKMDYCDGKVVKMKNPGL